MTRATFALLALILAMAACNPGPREARIGEDQCAHCRMTVSESRFAAQLITDRGRSFLFDSAECLAESLDEGEPAAIDMVRSLWVTDFDRPGVWLRVEEAHFLRSDHLRSPMGVGLSAYASVDEAAEARAEHGGEVLNWDEVRTLVAQIRVRGGGHSHAH